MKNFRARSLINARLLARERRGSGGAEIGEISSDSLPLELKRAIPPVNSQLFSLSATLPRAFTSLSRRPGARASLILSPNAGLGRPRGLRNLISPEVARRCAAPPVGGVYTRGKSRTRHKAPDRRGPVHNGCARPPSKVLDPPARKIRPPPAMIQSRTSSADAAAGVRVLLLAGRRSRRAGTEECAGGCTREGLRRRKF